MLNLRLPDEDAAKGIIGWKEKPLTVSKRTQISYMKNIKCSPIRKNFQH